MKRKEMLQRHKKRIIIVSITLAVVLAITAAVFFWWFRNKGNNNGFSFGGMQGGRNDFAITEDMVAATGVTSVGLIEESFDVENLTTALEIEEVYVYSEDTITEGTKVLKLSEESVAEARKELEQILKETDLAYRAGVIEYDQSLITAEYDRDSKLLVGEQAQAVYDETIAGLQDSVDRATEQLTEAKEQIAEYSSYVNDGSYREYFKVDEYQAIYDENLEILKDKMEEWDVSWSQIVGQSGAGSNAGGGLGGSFGVNGDNSGIAGVSFGNSGVQNQYVQVLSSMYTVLEQNREDLDQAESDYEDALVNAALDLQTLELKLPELEKNLAEAEKSYETQILQAKLTYETSLANAKSAEADYETAIEKAESDYEILKDEWESAKENLELFESSVGDGYFYASGNGTILRTMVRAGRELTSEATIFMYSNPEDMTVTVSVDQADIAKVALGDSAYIQSSEYRSFEGTVTEINPVSASSSRTSVTYQVTVQFDGGDTELGANESVTVIFGMSAELRENMQNGQERGQRPEGGQMPEGMERPEGGQMPEGMEMPERGQMPGNGEMPQGMGGSRPQSGNTGNE